MRILAIASLYPLSREDNAGQARHVTFRALCRQGHEVEVFRCQCRLPWLMMPRDWRRIGRPHVPAAYHLDGVPVTCPRFWRPPGGVFWRPYEGAWRFQAILPKAMRMHRRKPFDVIYGCELMPDGVAALLLGRALGLPVMLSSIGSDAHTYPFLTKAAMPRTQWVVRHADLIVVEGEGAIAAVQALVPEPLPIRPFNRGIDLERLREAPTRPETRRQLNLPPDERLIAFVGALGEWKGIRVLMEVFKRLQERFTEAGLILIGSGPLGGWLAEQAAGQPWGKRLHLVGQQPFYKVPQILTACDIFCLPSFGEGLPKSVVEAMASGLPVVATTVGGIPDTVRDGVTGLLVAPRDEAALEVALGRLLANPDQAKEMGRLGREIAYREFDGEKNAIGQVELASEAIERAKQATSRRMSPWAKGR
jgi:teichuronic acid biosynthesis glycosyltransferase TuaC